MQALGCVKLFDVKNFYRDEGGNNPDKAVSFDLLMLLQNGADIDPFGEDRASGDDNSVDQRHTVGDDALRANPVASLPARRGLLRIMRMRSSLALLRACLIACHPVHETSPT